MNDHQRQPRGRGDPPQRLRVECAGRRSAHLDHGQWGACVAVGADRYRYRNSAACAVVGDYTCVGEVVSGPAAGARTGGRAGLTACVVGARI